MLKKITVEYILSFMLVCLLLVQSIGGFFIKNLYRDNIWAISVLRGNDFVTFSTVVPLIIILLALSIKGFVRAKFILEGFIYYVLYSNVFYLFAIDYNQFFLLYIAIFIIAFFTFVYLFDSNLKLFNINNSFSEINTGRIVWFMIVLSGILFLMWISQYLIFVFTGQLPPIYCGNKRFSQIMAVLDISMNATPILLAAVWLFKCHSIGYLLSIVMLVHTSLSFIFSIVFAKFQYAAGVLEAWDLVPFWFILGLISFWFLIILLLKIKTKSI